MDVRRKPMPVLYTPPTQHSPAYQQHSRTRTTSSSIFPSEVYTPQYPINNNQNMVPPVQNFSSRRTPSTHTFSTINSSGNGPVPVRSTSQDLRRSTSSRSGGTIQPSGYVALMRKQKATVWCDRAQHEDPRMVAAQRAAKQRATKEVTGHGSGTRTSTSGSGSLAGGNRVAAKIRHHGKAGLVGYSPGDLVGGVGGVPMRLSASEVEGGDSDDDGDSTGPNGYGLYHQRTGSGRSSVGSGGRRGLTYSRQSGASSTVGRWSSGHTPPDTEPPVEDAAETPVPATHPRSKDYFPGDGNGKPASVGSGSSGERADGVAELSASKLASNNLLKSTTGTVKSLRNGGYGGNLARRGSVDDRTMTMTGRLYIANPDADSD
ncbi:hypothetical protein PVAG01_04831 [Phlyctema vagabunda]|uniref:Uncharacterized protein n=1 Tax=Phlyctema vagabunda TaxID=108571 RepID=A0ABR4PIE8_9HELO